ncbi:hypothetical protein J6590_059057 [Homalodisca vitripennis]|nr:hypothetical protein J6590_059057 [Homalodisca vitripennis]
MSMYLSIMFSNMKNKIREKTGSELPKLSLAQKSGIGRHSRQGSETSLSSLDPQPKEEHSPLPVSPNEIVLADGKVYYIVLVGHNSEMTVVQGYTVLVGQAGPLYLVLETI